MIIEKLDGFTADGLGKVIGAEADLVNGDVCRITDGDTVTEKRWYIAPPNIPTPIQLRKSEFEALLTNHGGDVNLALAAWPVQ